MPVARDHVEIERKPPSKPKTGGGGPGKIPHPRDFGGGDDGEPDRDENSSERSERLLIYRVLMVVCIVAVAVVFIVLTVAYLYRRSVLHFDEDKGEELHLWRPLVLPYLLLWINSLVLLASSGTLELARRQMTKQSEFASMGIVPPAGRRELSWLTATFGLGLGFLGGQALVWNTLRHRGLFLHANASSSFFYAFTALHAAHLVGGLVALAWLIFRSWRPRRRDFRQVALQATGWYWHFMGILWLAIFALLHFTRK